MQHLTQRMAAFVAETPASALTGNAREILRLSLLDWLAVAIAGRDEPVSRMVFELAAHDSGKPEASVIGRNIRLPARAAALVNGATSHALDYDDTHFDYIGHPSVVIFPAALAIAEKTGASGRAFLDAALIGMETACRIGRWLGMAHYQQGFHQTATAGCFGATAAAARLLGLGAERTAHALGLAATRASGLKSQFGTMGKPYNAGMAAANGVEVALLAAAGFVSRPDGLECDQGFGQTHAGEANNLETVLAGLGTDFRFQHVQHKFHACCHGTHAALEALATLQGQTSPGEIEQVELYVAPKWLKVCNLPTPSTGLEAKFSYRLTTAMALSGIDTGALSTFTQAQCNDTALNSLRDRVEAIADSSMTDTAARVRLVLRNSKVLSASHDLDQPIPLAVKTGKIVKKAGALVGAEKLHQVQTAIAQLEAGVPCGFTTGRSVTGA